MIVGSGQPQAGLDSRDQRLAMAEEGRRRSTVLGRRQCRPLQLVTTPLLLYAAPRGEADPWAS